MNYLNLDRIACALVLVAYFVSLSLIQTQRAFYLSASWLFALFIAFANMSLRSTTLKSRITDAVLLPGYLFLTHY